MLLLNLNEGLWDEVVFWHETKQCSSQKKEKLSYSTEL